MKPILLCIILGSILTFTSHAELRDKNINYRMQLNDYYYQDKELLVDEDVVRIAQIVVNNRENYSGNMTAKAFSLLSDIAFNQGNLISASQFAQYGSKIEKLDVLVKLDLLLKIARGYYSQGKYIELIKISKETALLAEKTNNMNYHLQASAYTVVAHALVSDFTVAITELNNVENLLAQTQQHIDQITLLEIIAEAHFYLAEYQNATELLNRVLSLRVEMSKVKGIARTYHLLATAYYQLKQYDNAYNAYWESMAFALKYDLEIRVSYAELGLGQVLYQQQNFSQAKTYLKKALRVFEGHNLPRTKLSVLIVLAQVNYKLNKPEQAINNLLAAENLAEELVLTPQQIELYLLLAEHYQGTNQLKKALAAQKRYIDLYKAFKLSVNLKKKLASIALKTSNKAKSLALNLAEQSELSLQFNEKYYQQKVIITVLSILLILIGLLFVWGRFRQYRRKLNKHYDEIELPSHRLSRPVQTKHWYQQQYKIARKYQYNITIAYLVIDNWQELKFHFTAKILNDVYKAVAVAVNENLDDEDYCGVISSGEYLFLCPHQCTEQMKVKLTRISQAMKIRHFVNLGNYPVNISFALDSPTFQDIDPYVFLSGLSTRVNAKFKVKQ